ncbi:hypothetical protein AGMMS49965_12500 [Bacteroidia bacterium]|nr:hypothetical protein AGMMS49965_12500 [Bacteroidia bacterium]
MNDSLNTILGRLEKDLEKLQTARKQVESVVASNKEFTTTVNSLITNTTSLVNEIKTVTEGAIVQFSEKLTESKNSVDKVVVESINHIENNIKKAEVVNNKLQETIETKINEISTIASTTITKQKEIAATNINDVSKLASKSIAENQNQSLATIKDASKLAKTTLEEQKQENLKTLNQFSEQLTETKNNLQILFEQAKKNIEQVGQAIQENTTTKITDLSNLATKSIEEQKQENLKTLNQILETHNQIKQLIGQLLDLDLPNSLKSLNSNIEKLQLQSNKQFQSTKKMQVWSLIGISVLTVIVIVFKFIL